MKKQYGLLCLFFVILLAPVYMQGVGINTTGLAPDSSAILDVSATNKGALFPRMTTAQRNGIPNPATGLLIYNLDIDCYQYFDGSSWFDLCGQQKEKPLMLPWRTGVGNWNIVRNVFIDKYTLVTQNAGFGTFDFRVVLPNKNMQYRNFLLDWIDGVAITSVVVVDSSLYLLVWKTTVPQSYRVYKYNLYNIASGGSLVTLSGLGFAYPGNSNLVIMTSDGTNIYFNYNAGNSTNDYIIAKYAITSPTIFTYQNSITCGATFGSFQRLIVDSGGNLYGGGASAISVFTKCNSSGAFIYQTVSYDLGTNNYVLNWDGTYYMQGSGAAYYYYRIWLE